MPNAYGWKTMQPEHIATIWKYRQSKPTALAEKMEYTQSTIGKWQRMLQGKAPITLRNVEKIPAEVLAQCHTFLDYNLIDNKRYPDNSAAVSRAINAVVKSKLDTLVTGHTFDMTQQTLPEVAQEIADTLGTQEIPSAAEVPIGWLFPGYDWLREHKTEVDAVRAALSELFAAYDSLFDCDAPGVFSFIDKIHASRLSQIMAGICGLRTSMKAKNQRQKIS